MKLIGFVKGFKDMMIIIPIYFDGSKHYYHNIDDNFIIRKFDAISYDILNSSDYISIDNMKSESFNIGEYSAIVFSGFNNLYLYGRVNKVINNIKDYVYKNTDDCTYNGIKLEIEIIMESINEKISRV